MPWCLFFCLVSVMMDLWEYEKAYILLELSVILQLNMIKLHFILSANITSCIFL